MPWSSTPWGGADAFWSGGGISAISSLPYALSLALPALSLGTWTYLFQGALVAGLMVLRRRFVPAYLFSFVVGFLFGKPLSGLTPAAWRAPWCSPCRLGQVGGPGIGTVVALTMGKVIG